MAGIFQKGDFFYKGLRLMRSLGATGNPDLAWGEDVHGKHDHIYLPVPVPQNDAAKFLVRWNLTTQIGVLQSSRIWPDVAEKVAALLTSRDEAQTQEELERLLG